MHGGAAERVDGELQPCCTDRVHVDDVAQIIDVGLNQIFLTRAGCLYSRFIRDALDASVTSAQQLVRPLLDPLRHIGVGWTAVGRVVLETAIFRRVM